jgi:hypothetical protein
MNVTQSRLDPQPLTHLDYYVFRIMGHLAPQCADWFEGLIVTNTETHETILSGWIADQAALHGVLAKIRDLNLTLISVNRKDLP